MPAGEHHQRALHAALPWDSPSELVSQPAGELPLSLVSANTSSSSQQQISGSPAMCLQIIGAQLCGCVLKAANLAGFDNKMCKLQAALVKT